MNLTVQDIITAQLRGIGVLGEGQAPTAQQLTDMIQGNNIMLDNWSSKRLMVRSLTTDDFPLVASKASYTIGVGADFNTSKPLMISDAFVRDTYDVDIPLDIWNEDQYNAQDDKDFVQSRPEALYYDPGAAQQATQAGTIWMYPIPDDTTQYTLYITSQKYLNEFVNPGDAITFEPAYFKALKFNGIVEMWYDYRSIRTAIPANIMRLARESMRDIKTLNDKAMLIGLDIPGMKRSTFNILSGEDIG